MAALGTRVNMASLRASRVLNCKQSHVYRKSLAAHQQIRLQSNTSTPPPATPAPNSQPSGLLDATNSTPNPTAKSPNPPKPPRYRQRALIYSTLSLLLGVLAGNFITFTISPPADPLPGSATDKLIVHDLSNRIDSEFKVKILRGKARATGAKLRGEDGAWVEVASSLSEDDENVVLPRKNGDVPAWLAERDEKEGLRQQALALGLRYEEDQGLMTREAMAGARGLGVERLFWNTRNHELVAVVWFGGGLSGWPGVTHGGAIATVLGEKAALAAQLLRMGGEYEGAARDAEGITRGPELQNLQLSYKKPTHARGFYVVRMKPRVDIEGTATMVGTLGKEVEVEGTLETMDGKICVQMNGTVPVADNAKGGLQTAKEAAKGTGLGKWFGMG
ncbi:hypothetical protein MBLNU457_3246t1 [Dothideomycetes sp. NU457]